MDEESGSTHGCSGSLPVACAAPFSSMYLDARGNVRVCCVNSTFPLGNVRTESLVSMWHGARMGRIRRAMQEWDFSMGCDLCESPSRNEDHPIAPARAFDRFRGMTALEWPRQLELALSNTCNLECEMCFGEFSSSIRRNREGLPPIHSAYDERVLSELEEFLPHLEQINVIGGEPFLSREMWRVWGRVHELGLTPRFRVTTNGTIRNRRVEWLLEHFDVDLTVSIDGATPETYERIRRGARFQDVLDNLDYFAGVARQRGRGIDLAFCLTTDSWRELPDVLGLGDSLGMPVGVNVVSEPARLSLWRASAETLTKVAAEWMDLRETVADDLTLNRQEWLDNVDWSVSAAKRAREEYDQSAVSVELSVDPRRLALGIARAHSPDSSVLLVDIDADDRILGFDGFAEFAQATGLTFDPSDLVGRPFIALMSGPVVDRFGPSFTSHISDRHNGRVRVHEMTFDAPEAISIHVAMAPRASPEGHGRAFVTAAVGTGRRYGGSMADGVRVSGGIDASRILRQDDLHQAFVDDGFVSVALAEPAHLAEVSDRVLDVVPDVGFFSLYRHDSPELRRRLDSMMREEFEHLLKPVLRDYRVYLANVFVKFPGSSVALDLHQDWSFVDEEQHVNALVWLPFESSNPRVGGLHVVRGSHRFDLPFRGSPSGEQASRPVEPLINDRHLEHLETSVGEAVIYHTSLIHGSTANSSDTPRVVAVIGVNSADSDLFHYFVDAEGQKWRCRVTEEFFFDYSPPEPPQGSFLLDKEPWDSTHTFLSEADLEQLPVVQARPPVAEVTAPRQHGSGPARRHSFIERVKGWAK